MAKRNPNYNYIDKKIYNRNTGKLKGIVETLITELYCIDGSIFKLPWGGDPATYTNKMTAERTPLADRFGANMQMFQAKPTPKWEEQHEIWLSEKASSTRFSDKQRELRLKKIQVQNKVEEVSIIHEEKEMDRQLAIANKALADMDQGILPTAPVPAQASTPVTVVNNAPVPVPVEVPNPTGEVTEPDPLQGKDEATEIIEAPKPKRKYTRRKPPKKRPTAKVEAS